ncbi:MAG: hypothetical protein R3E01_34435 [Pirellulaceae bacterium]|nr:ComF family protein [Planctomycetales bacterium]
MTSSRHTGASVRHLVRDSYAGMCRSSWTATALNLLFSCECAFCQSKIKLHDYHAAFCQACVGRLKAEASQMCQRCGAVSETGVRGVTEGDRPKTCRQCLDKKFRFRRVIALGNYEGYLRDAVLRTKHIHEQPLASALGGILAERIGAELSNDLPDVLVATPMHWWRRLSRGAGCGEVMAERMAEQLGIPFQLRALSPCRNTQKQSMLTPSQRRRNVRGAWRITPGVQFSGHVALVDDILTTGATANELTRQLLSAGATHVTLCVAARAIRI